MASAVAVEADIHRPALPDNLDDDEEITGKITSVEDGTDASDDGDVPPVQSTIKHSIEQGLDEDKADVNEDLFGDGAGDDEEDQPEESPE